MASFYKMDPVLWDHGTVDLSLEEEAAYLRIINAIYRSEQGCPMNDRVLAGMFRSSTRKARALVDALIQKGKVFARDGYLWNDKADRELNSIRNHGPKSPRNDDETPMKGKRNGREPDVKAERTVIEPATNPLINAETIESEPPPKTKTKTEKKTETKDKDFLERAFESFWAEYPRRLTDSGTLVKGSRQQAFDAFCRLEDEVRQAAIDGLPGFKRVYPDSSKGVCDAVRYFTHQRWRDTEGLAVKPMPGIVLPKNSLAPKIKRLISVISLEKYRGWFENGGICIIHPRGDDGAVIKPMTNFAAERIKNEFFTPLNTVFGYGKWTIEGPRQYVAGTDVPHETLSTG